MSERYSILYSLPAETYAAGAPLIALAGNLLKDNTTQELLVQLKLHSLSVRPIRAVTVRILPLDTAKRPLGEAIECPYLDLQVKTGDDFGQKIATTVPDARARAFSVSVAEVIFDDGSVWQESGAAWEPLPKGKSLEKALADPELLKQFKLRFGNDSVYLPMEHGDLWRCACGAWNREAQCGACGKEKAAFLPLNRAELEAEKDARLAREKAEREEQAAKAEAQEKRAKKITLLCSAAVMLCIAVLLLITKVIIPGNAYRDAVSLFEAGQYDEAVAAFEAMGDYKDSAEQKVRIGEAKYESDYQAALSLEQSGESYAAATAFYAMSDYKDARTHCFDLWRTLALRETLSAGYYHAVGLKADGTVVAVGDNDYGRLDVGDWTDIVAVSAGGYHAVGLKADGTVVAAGDNEYGQCNVGSWTDIVAISAVWLHTVGLKADGTVVAVGWNEYGQCDVGDWENIVDVSAGGGHTVGLKADGTVVAVGYNKSGQRDVSGWTDIVAVSASAGHTVGLKADGTVVAVGDNEYGQCDVGGWTDIVAVSAGTLRTVGLRADGTVVAVGYNDNGQCDVGGWTDIVAVSAGAFHTVGLKADGTVVAVGDSFLGQLDISDWKLKLPD